ncbi:hypothetical protein pb186bvf_020765 [Paramecium bursaria]
MMKNHKKILLYTKDTYHHTNKHKIQRNQMMITQKLMLKPLEIKKIFFFYEGIILLIQAILLEQQRNYEEAVQKFKEKLQIDHEDRLSLVHIGLILIQFRTMFVKTWQSRGINIIIQKVNQCPQLKYNQNVCTQINNSQVISISSRIC